METPTFTITNQNAPTVLIELGNMINHGLQSAPVVVTLSREKRSLDANAKLWAMLTDISKQVEHANTMFSREDWKDILTAGYEEQRLVPGVSGNFVAIGSRTSQYNKKKMSEFIEYMYWFGAEKEVKWSEESVAIYEEYKAYAEQEAQM